MRIVAWGLSDTGTKREHNEDSLLMARDLQLYAVADGMGGHRAGDRASQMAVKILEEELRSVELEDAAGRRLGIDETPGRRLQEAAAAASAKIFAEASNDSATEGMGTTLTSLLIFRGRAYLAHVGDSRCYLYRDGRLEQLTSDHSWIEEQVRAGLMSRAEADQSALKHVVTRSVGFEEEVEVDLMAMPTLMGDCFLLCSDGLSNYLNERQLRDYLERGYYSEVPKRLVDTANALGGDDNITVVLVYVANHRLDSPPATRGEVGVSGPASAPGSETTPEADSEIVSDEPTTEPDATSEPVTPSESEGVEVAPQADIETEDLDGSGKPT